MKAIERMLRELHLGPPGRLFPHALRTAAERELAGIATVLATVETNASFNADGTVTLPLWVMDRIRALRGT